MEIPKSVLFLKNNLTPKNYKKVALFDLDNTIIKNFSREMLHRHAIWPFFSKSVLRKIKKLHEENYLIGIISNQACLKQLKLFSKKAQYFLNVFKTPIFLMAALDYDFFRKPLPGIFEIIKKKYFNGRDVDGFFVGDAAGRENDHSNDDYNFAVNCKLKFYTPEQFFTDEKSEFVGKSFDPNKFKCEKILDLKKNVIVVGRGKFSGRKHFTRKNNKNCVYFTDVQNFSDISKLVKGQNKNEFVCVYLNYTLEQHNFIKIMSKLQKIESSYEYRSSEIVKFVERNENACQLFFEKFGFELIMFDFCYDDSFYTEYEKHIASFKLC